MIDHSQLNFIYHFHPNQTISIAENMIWFNGKIPNLSQHMVIMHHARFGIKVWGVWCTKWLCMYVWSIERFCLSDTCGEGITYNLEFGLLIKNGGRKTEVRMESCKEELGCTENSMWRIQECDKKLTRQGSCLNCDALMWNLSFLCNHFTYYCWVQHWGVEKLFT